MVQTIITIVLNMDKNNQKSSKRKPKITWDKVNQTHFAIIKKTIDEHKGTTDFGSNFTIKERNEFMVSSNNYSKFLLCFIFSFSWSVDHEKY